MKPAIDFALSNAKYANPGGRMETPPALRAKIVKNFFEGDPMRFNYADGPSATCRHPEVGAIVPSLPNSMGDGAGGPFLAAVAAEYWVSDISREVYDDERRYLGRRGTWRVAESDNHSERLVRKEAQKCIDAVNFPTCEHYGRPQRRARSSPETP